MTFLIGGGVTPIPAALAVWAITPGKVLAAYLGVAMLGALLTGFVFQAVVG